MSLRTFFQSLFERADRLPAKEADRLSEQLNAGICPTCQSKDKMGFRPAQSINVNVEMICHVCGEGWQLAPQDDNSLRAVRHLGVVIAPYHTAYLAGDRSDKHQPALYE